MPVAVCGWLPLHMQRVIDYLYDEWEVYQNICDPATTSISRMILECEWFVYNKMGEILCYAFSNGTALKKKKAKMLLQRSYAFCKFEAVFMVFADCAVSLVVQLL